MSKQTTWDGVYAVVRTDVFKTLSGVTIAIGKLSNGKWRWAGYANNGVVVGGRARREFEEIHFFPNQELAREARGDFNEQDINYEWFRHIFVLDVDNLRARPSSSIYAELATMAVPEDVTCSVLTRFSGSSCVFWGSGDSVGCALMSPEKPPASLRALGL